MFYEIKHEIPGRLRLRCGKRLFDEETGFGIEKALCSIDGVSDATVRPVNGSVLVCYDPASPSARDEVLSAVRGLDPLDLPHAEPDAEAASKASTNRFQLRLISAVASRYARKFLLPAPIRNAVVAAQAVGYVWKGVKCLAHGKLAVEVLDATAIGVAVSQGKFATAGSVMFLLHISDILADYTRERTRSALRKNLAFAAESVWVVGEDGVEVEVPIEDVEIGDVVHVRTGQLVPIDGCVVEGRGEVNEASMTGESALVKKEVSSTVYAGTALDEGSLFVRATAKAGQSRIDAIVQMVEDSEECKAGVQSRAERLADGLVPISLGLFLLDLAITRNVARAMSVLMVDYSCAIKLTTPIAVMSAMREATRYGVVAKGGKYLEALAKADTIVFDKTGTLTNACPTVEKVIPFNKQSADELLRLAACLEEHFPHSLARAIVRGAEERKLNHKDEHHAEVEYIVAHGIASSVDGKSVRLGSAHFIFEDEGIKKPRGLDKKLEREAPAASTVFMAVDGELAAAICVSDPVRSEAPDIIAGLRERGFRHIVMLTGDSENCARHVAEQLGIDEYHAQVLPEDKASFVEELKRQGHCVAMVGDGINDSPALAAADVSIAMSDASDIARTVADVSILQASLDSLLVARDVSHGLISRINGNYSFIAAFNTALIVAGMIGIIQPATGALLHNASTALLSAASTRPVVKARHVNKLLADSSSTTVAA